jgi:hypothetical protein
MAEEMLSEEQPVSRIAAEHCRRGPADEFEGLGELDPLVVLDTGLQPFVVAGDVVA